MLSTEARLQWQQRQRPAAHLRLRHEVVEQRLQRGARARRQQVVGLRHDVLGHVRAAQELRHLLAEVVAVVLQQVVRARTGTSCIADDHITMYHTLRL